MRPMPILSRVVLSTLAWILLVSSLSAQVGVSLEPSAAGNSEQAQFDLLMKQVDTAIDVNSRRYLVANTHSPWQIFHGILALGQNFQVKLDQKKISAIEWIATADTKFDNEPLIVVTDRGANFHSFSRPYAFQGHPGQFLALLTHSNLPPDFKFHTPTKDVTLLDILKDTMWSVNSSEEITWVLWGLNHYLSTDAHWTNKTGEAWSIERLVQIETQNVVEKAACGGNHGLFALSRTRDKYLKAGHPLRGTWLAADHKVKRYIEIARSMQNSDGTFSANFYVGPEHATDINKRLNSTGHTLEFLAVALPDQRLKEPWVQNSVWALSKDLVEHRHQAVDCGPLYHSLDALIIYRDRIQSLKAPEQLVLKPSSNNEPVSIKNATAAPSLILVPKIEPQPPKPGPISALEPANAR